MAGMFSFGKKNANIKVQVNRYNNNSQNYEQNFEVESDVIVNATDAPSDTGAKESGVFFSFLKNLFSSNDNTGAGFFDKVESILDSTKDAISDLWNELFGKEENKEASENIENAGFAVEDDYSKLTDDYPGFFGLFDSIFAEFDKELEKYDDEIAKIEEEKAQITSEVLELNHWFCDVNTGKELDPPADDLTQFVFFLMYQKTWHQMKQEYDQKMQKLEDLANRINEINYEKKMFEIAKLELEHNLKYNFYNGMTENEDFANLSSRDLFSEELNKLFDNTFNNKYLTDDEISVLIYLTNKYGINVAQDYYTALSETVKYRIGHERALENLDSIIEKDENGNYVYLLDENGNFKLDKNGNKIPKLVEKGLIDEFLATTYGYKYGFEGYVSGFINRITSMSQVGELTEKDIEELYTTSWLIEMGRANEILFGMGSSLGNMTIPLGLSTLLTVLSKNPKMGTALYSTLSYLSNSGSSIEEGLKKGMSPEQAYFYGIFSAGAEAIIEVLIGGIPGFKLPSNVLNLFQDALMEAGEEVIQYLSSVIIDYFATGEMIFSADEMLNSGASAVLISLLLGGGRMVVETKNGKVNIDMTKSLDNHSLDAIKEAANYMLLREQGNDIDINTLSPEAQEIVKKSYVSNVEGEQDAPIGEDLNTDVNPETDQTSETENTNEANIGEDLIENSNAIEEELPFQPVEGTENYKGLPIKFKTSFVINGVPETYIVDGYIDKKTGKPAGAVKHMADDLDNMSNYYAIEISDEHIKPYFQEISNKLKEIDGNMKLVDVAENFKSLYNQNKKLKPILNAIISYCEKNPGTDKTIQDLMDDLELFKEIYSLDQNVYFSKTPSDDLKAFYKAYYNSLSEDSDIKQKYSTFDEFLKSFSESSQNALTSENYNYFQKLCEGAGLTNDPRYIQIQELYNNSEYKNGLIMDENIRKIYDELSLLAVEKVYNTALENFANGKLICFDANGNAINFSVDNISTNIPYWVEINHPDGKYMQIIKNPDGSIKHMLIPQGDKQFNNEVNKTGTIEKSVENQAKRWMEEGKKQGLSKEEIKQTITNQNGKNYVSDENLRKDVIKYIDNNF